MTARDCFNVSNSLCRKMIKIDRLQKREDRVTDRITIPIILFGKDLKPFKAFGNVGDVKDDKYGCFETFMFKVEDFTSCCATLSLFRPIDENGCIARTICETYRLEETDFCVDVDFHCFYAIERVSMSLINRPFGHICPK